MSHEFFIRYKSAIIRRQPNQFSYVTRK